MGFTLGDPLGDVLRGFLGLVFDWYLTSLSLSPLTPSSLLYIQLFHDRINTYSLTYYYIKSPEQPPGVNEENLGVVVAMF